MPRPDIRIWNGMLFRKQLTAVLDWLEANSGGGGGGGATDLAYDAPSRVLSSSTGDDATLPLAATEAGLMSGADKAKLDGVAAGATVNSADAALLARGNHTGTQPAATISDLSSTVQAYPLDVFADPVAPVEFAQQQALQFVIENRTSDPGAPVSGQLWLRTDL
jgi:hypothetical protein